MKPINYYNEFDPKAAAWLRQLIKNGLIADGVVDDRSIIDVDAADLRGFTQHHFFAGIGGWSYALRLAGWPDDRPVCTASLPCQPFSVAGIGKGKDDERHLLPHFIELVKQCNFRTIFGEQVPGAIKHGWLDDLCLEMERENYAVGSIVLTASGAGAPHIRQRIYWVADSNDKGSQRRTRTECADKLPVGSDCLVDAQHQQHERVLYGHREEFSQNRERSAGESSGSVQATEWANPDWLYCRDNKYRPIKPGIKPLADGVSKGMVYSRDPSEPIDADNTQEARVMRLKGYGNAIVPQVAAQFITAFMNVDYTTDNK